MAMIAFPVVGAAIGAWGASAGVGLWAASYFGMSTAAIGWVAGAMIGQSIQSSIPLDAMPEIALGNDDT